MRGRQAPGRPQWLGGGDLGGDGRREWPHATGGGLGWMDHAGTLRCRGEEGPLRSRTSRRRASRRTGREVATLRTPRWWWGRHADRPGLVRWTSLRSCEHRPVLGSSPFGAMQANPATGDRCPASPVPATPRSGRTRPATTPPATSRAATPTRWTATSRTEPRHAASAPAPATTSAAGAAPQQPDTGQVLVHEPVQRQVTHHPHGSRRVRLMDGGATQDHLQRPSGNLEQHPEQAEASEHRAQLVGLRNTQRRRPGSEEEFDGENERNRLRDLDDQAPAQSPPPQPSHRITQRMGMTRQGEGAHTANSASTATRTMKPMRTASTRATIKIASRSR